MEAAPLTLAHAHARNASLETQKSNLIAASEEHDLAAGEFASAAKSTGDTEALRILKLLEQHHQRLAELTKFPRAEIVQPSLANSPSLSRHASISKPSSQPPSQPASIENDQVPALSTTQHPPLPVKLPNRDIGSSITSNLASARGIPSNRQRRGIQPPAQVTAQHAEGRVLSPPRRGRLGEQDVKSSLDIRKRPTSASRLAAKSDADSLLPIRGTSQAPAQSEDSFSRFYATFEGLLSKLSAPLAFAGLPLVPEDNSTPSPQKEKLRFDHRPPPPNEPDVTRLFSKAALRAVREENGPGGNGFGGAESFYVVPTTGGTISYAGILNRTGRESRISEGMIDEEDEFVDARETPSSQPVSPGLLKKRGLFAHGNSKPVNTKTMEELQLENEALRAIADDLSVRLHRFEVNAQNSTMALHMSMRAFHSPTTSAVSPAMAGAQSSPTSKQSAAGGSGAEEKLRELEEVLQQRDKEKDKLRRENEKLKGVVERYREKWEKLKDGARERMASGGSKGNGNGNGNGEGVGREGS
ncbi:MAG: hypothetical protein MMC33_003971 [Icmadophila ericetorum]|nr:hypothetical protein [Icmadophila ericetorum]